MGYYGYIIFASKETALKTPWNRSFPLFLLALLSTGALAQSPVTLIKSADFTLSKPTDTSAILAKTVGKERQVAGKTVLKITIKTPASPDYQLQLNQVVATPLLDKTVLRFRFWARSKTKNPIRAVFEQSSDPYTKAIEKNLILSPVWQEFGCVGISPAYPAGGSAVHFVLGQQAGEVEIAEAKLENFGVNPQKTPSEINISLYGVQAHNDEWRKAANERIAKYRMGGIEIRVVGADGKPVSNAKVHLEQTSHAFKFGTAITDGPLFDQSQSGEKYRKNLVRLFNYVVFENQLKWIKYYEDHYEIAEKMLEWCHDNGLPVRGHNLLWAGFKYLPDDIAKLRGQALRDAVKSHILKYTALTKGKLKVWDVVNEAVANRDVENAAGRDLLARAFDWAHEADPDTLLCYNEDQIFHMNGETKGVNDERVDEVLNYLLKEQKAPVNVLGIQAHMGAPLVPAPLLIENLNHWATYGLPIEITEFDAGIRDDRAHALYFDEFLTAIFSHPKVTSFVMWGFWEGAHWRADEGAALFRKDWSERPAVVVFDRLIHKTWWTDATGKTRKKGSFSTRAFLGDYKITVTKGGKTAEAHTEVSKNEDGITVVSISL